MLVLLLITIVSFSCPVAEEMQFHLRRTGKVGILLQVVLFSYRFLGKATNDSATAVGPATCRQFPGMLLGHSGFSFGFLVWLGLRIVETWSHRCARWKRNWWPGFQICGSWGSVPAWVGPQSSLSLNALHDLKGAIWLSGTLCAKASWDCTRFHVAPAWVDFTHIFGRKTVGNWPPGIPIAPSSLGLKTRLQRTVPARNSSCVELYLNFRGQSWTVYLNWRFRKSQFFLGQLPIVDLLIADGHMEMIGIDMNWLHSWEQLWKQTVERVTAKWKLDLKGSKLDFKPFSGIKSCFQALCSNGSWGYLSVPWMARIRWLSYIILLHYLAKCCPCILSQVSGPLNQFFPLDVMLTQPLWSHVKISFWT